MFMSWQHGWSVGGSNLGISVYRRERGASDIEVHAHSGHGYVRVSFVARDRHAWWARTVSVRFPVPSKVKFIRRWSV